MGMGTSWRLPFPDESFLSLKICAGAMCQASEARHCCRGFMCSSSLTSDALWVYRWIALPDPAPEAECLSTNEDAPVAFISPQAQYLGALIDDDLDKATN